MKCPNNRRCDFNSKARKNILHPNSRIDWNEVERSSYRPRLGLFPIVRLRSGRWLVDSKCETVCAKHIPTGVSDHLKWALTSIKLKTISGDTKKLVLDVFECVALLTIQKIVPWTSTIDDSGKYDYPTLTCTRPVGVQRLGRASRLDFVEGAGVYEEFQGRVEFLLTGGEPFWK